MAGSTNPIDQQVIDHQYMTMALAMARRGLGTTAPNPSVGAVIVDDKGVILGRGWTQPGGRPHAEVVALERAGKAAKGATLYVTLEPCSHHGKSPPCADAVIDAGITRVICGVKDPNELVAGQGFARLREAGIEVIENVLADDAHWLTLGHILKVGKNRPFVQLKLATGCDGLIAPGDGEPVWVTGPQARAQGHLLRARADAILVGIGTVLADDPTLDCRLPGMEGRSPLIFVLDRHCRFPASAKLARKAANRLVTIVTVTGRDKQGGGGVDKTFKDANSAMGSIFYMSDNESAQLNEFMSGLVDVYDGISRLLVEGGPHIWRSFLDAGLVEEIVHFKGPKPAGGQGLKPFVDQGMERIEQNGKFEMVDQRAVGDDKMIVYRNKNSMKVD